MGTHVNRWIKEENKQWSNILGIKENDGIKESKNTRNRIGRTQDSSWSLWSSANTWSAKCNNRIPERANLGSQNSQWVYKNKEKVHVHISCDHIWYYHEGILDKEMTWIK